MIFCFKSIPTSKLVVATSKVVVGLFYRKGGLFMGTLFFWFINGGNSPYVSGGV